MKLSYLNSTILLAIVATTSAQAARHEYNCDTRVDGSSLSITDLLDVGDDTVLATLFYDPYPGSSRFHRSVSIDEAGPLERTVQGDRIRFKNGAYDLSALRNEDGRYEISVESTLDRRDLGKYDCDRVDTEGHE